MLERLDKRLDVLTGNMFKQENETDLQRLFKAVKRGLKMQSVCSLVSLRISLFFSLDSTINVKS